MHTRHWMLRAVAHCSTGCCTMGSGLTSSLPIFFMNPRLPLSRTCPLLAIHKPKKKEEFVHPSSLIVRTVGSSYLMTARKRIVHRRCRWLDDYSLWEQSDASSSVITPVVVDECCPTPLILISPSSITSGLERFTDSSIAKNQKSPIAGGFRAGKCG